MKLKHKLISVLSALLAAISSLFLLASLALGTVKFTFSDSETVTSGVIDNLDIDIIDREIEAQINNCSTIYGFDSALILEKVHEIDTYSLVKDYFTDYYTSFTEGREFPTLTLNSDDFYTVITENKDRSTRPEVYELEENRKALADKYALCVTLPISSLSFNLIESAASKADVIYNRFAALSNYFIPSVVIFVCLLGLLVLLIVIFKRRGAAYYTALLYFVVTLFPSVPMLYLALAELPSRFNVKIGAAYAYLDAIYNYVFNTGAKTLVCISIGAFALFLITVFANIFKKEQKPPFESEKLPTEEQKQP